MEVKALLPPLLMALAASPALPAHNALTRQESDAGYFSMFNGADLHGWKSWNSPTPVDDWEAAAESTWKVLAIKTGNEGEGNLVSKDEMQNFDLKLEWAVAPGGGSGVSARYLPHPPLGDPTPAPWAFGPYTPAVDTTVGDSKQRTHASGDGYEIFPVDSARRHWFFPGLADSGGAPVYRYNQFRMIVHGRHVAHYGNGRKLLEYVIGTELWNLLRKESKPLNSAPLCGDVHAGSVVLANLGGKGVRFRDLRFKNLGLEDGENNPWAPGSPYLKDPDDTASGLKDELTFDDNLIFPSNSAISPLRPGPRWGNVQGAAFDPLGRARARKARRPVLFAFPVGR